MKGQGIKWNYPVFSFSFDCKKIQMAFTSNYCLHFSLKFLVLFSVMLKSLSVFAQSDSLSFVNAKWEIKKVSKGIKLRRFSFNQSLYLSNQNVSIIEVKMNRKNRIAVEGDATTLKYTSEFGKEHNALAAINGTFFDIKNGGSVDYIRIDGKVINETKIAKSRAFHQQSAIVIKNGKLFLNKWDGTGNWEKQLPGEDVMVSGPLLMVNFQRAKMDSIPFNLLRHPRSALAIKGRKLMLITVDGRSEKAAGMSLFELASVLKWLNVANGINLDGGGSTTLWINGFPDGGVVNYPSDNKKWDHAGERKVANVILVKKRK